MLQAFGVSWMLTREPLRQPRLCDRGLSKCKLQGSTGRCSPTRLQRSTCHGLRFDGMLLKETCKHTCAFLRLGNDLEVACSSDNVFLGIGKPLKEIIVVRNKRWNRPVATNQQHRQLIRLASSGPNFHWRSGGSSSVFCSMNRASQSSNQSAGRIGSITFL